MLALVAEKLGCSMIHVEIGRRPDERRATSKLVRLVRDYRQFAVSLGGALATKLPVTVHVNSSVQYASLLRDLVFVLIARLLHADRLVAQIHGCELDDAAARQTPLRQLARLLAAAVDRFVVLSPAQAVAIGGPARDAAVIPNAVVLQAPVLRLAPHQARGTLRLLYLARMIPQKGVLTCLDALRLLRDHGVQAELTIVGDGPLLAELPRRVKALELEDRVTVTGAVAARQVRPLLATHDLLWAPSTYAEGQPYALIEALEAGLPVLACVPNSAMQDLVAVADGAVLALAPGAEALATATLSLVATPDAIASMQAAARQVAAGRFSLEASLPLWRDAWTAATQVSQDARLPVASEAPGGGKS
jgi:glycosyltransferase involved in cell wall biosynthesis